MDTSNTVQLFQKGFRVTLGATTSLLEALQDPQKRQENLSHLRLEFNELTQLWEEKGEATEVEARNFVDNLLSQQTSCSTSTATNRPEGGARTTGPGNRSTQAELEALTTELAALRTELEQQRQQSAG